MMTAKEAIEILRCENKNDAIRLIDTPKFFKKRRITIQKRIDARIKAIVALKLCNPDWSEE